MDFEERTFEALQVQELGPHLAIVVTDGVDAILKRVPGQVRLVEGNSAVPNLSAWASALVSSERRCIVSAKVIRVEDVKSKRGNLQVHFDDWRIVGHVKVEKEEDDQGAHANEEEKGSLTTKKKNHFFSHVCSCKRVSSSNLD